MPWKDWRYRAKESCFAIYSRGTSSKLGVRLTSLELGFVTVP